MQPLGLGVFAYVRTPLPPARPLPKSPPVASPPLGAWEVHGSKHV